MRRPIVLVLVLATACYVPLEHFHRDGDDGGTDSQDATTMTYRLGVTRTGGGAGTVTSNPAGIDCGSDCTEDYLEGTVIALTAVGVASTLTSWTGGGCNGVSPCSVTLTADTTVQATFQPVCADAIDNDGDNKTDYPADPGCDSPADGDEGDDCPLGPNCPACANNNDDDTDGFIDFGMDTACVSASGKSEACTSNEVVNILTTGSTMGNTMSASNDVDPLCDAATGMGADLTYRLDVPSLSKLNIGITAGFDSVIELFNSTCGGTPIVCIDPNMGTVTNLAAGPYYLVVDGFDTSQRGPFTLSVSGTISAGASCESVLAQSGALACGSGYGCAGSSGSRTCQKTQCFDGMDNDGDTKTDYPDDSGCSSLSDLTEGSPPTTPQCADNVDNDSDGSADYPSDYGCTSAASDNEVFCSAEKDTTSLILTTPVSGTTIGKMNDTSPPCQTQSMGADIAYALQLPVPVANLVIDTIGSSFDTQLTFRDTTCGTVIACDDDGGGGLRSKITLSDVAPGGYAIVIDAYQTSGGTTTLNVHGTVVAGTPCGSSLFTNGVLSCEGTLTCSGVPKVCQ